MSRLHIYTVHINPSQPQPYEAAQFVEEGFSWKAFIFSGVWLLYHRLWAWSLCFFAFEWFLARAVEAHHITHIGAAIFEFAVLLLIGFQAGDLRRTVLKKRGYITADIVTGDSLLRAEQRFFDRYFASRTSASFAQ